MVRGQEIPKAKRLAIMSLRGYKTAQEIAQIYDIGERSVIRIWSEGATEKLADDLRQGAEKVQSDLDQYGHHHPIYPEMVQMMEVKHLFQLYEDREYFRAMMEAYPHNSVWANSLVKTNHDIGEQLRKMGNWYGMEKQKEPLTSTGVRNQDLTDFDYQEMANLLQKVKTDD